MGVADLLRRKLELDSSQAEDFAATTKEDVERKHRRKVRSSARRQRQLHTKDDKSKDIRTASQQQVDFNKLSHLDSNSVGLNQDLSCGPGIAIDGGIANDDETAATVEEPIQEDAQNKG